MLVTDSQGDISGVDELCGTRATEMMSTELSGWARRDGDYGMANRVVSAAMRRASDESDVRTTSRG